MSERVTPRPDAPAGRPLTWLEIRAEAVLGLRAAISERAQVSRIRPVVPEAQDMPDRSLLHLTPRHTPPGGWDTRAFVLMDASGDADAAAGGTDPDWPVTPPRRVPLELKYASTGDHLVLEVTPEVRAELPGADLVWVGYAQDEQLDRQRRMLTQLESAHRGARVADLWSARGLDRTVDPGHLDAAQARALAATLTGGGWLVWGEPGERRTETVVEAVHRALAAGKTVLVTAPVPGPVDAVLIDLSLAGPAQRRPGVAVRVPDVDADPEAAQGVAHPDIAGHRWLSLDRAAAVRVRRDDRLRELDDEARANHAHTDREAMDRIRAALAQEDVERLDQAQAAVHAAEQTSLLTAGRDRLLQRTEQIAAQLAAVSRRREQAREQAAGHEDAVASVQDAERQAEQWAQVLARAEATVADLAAHRDELAAVHAELHDALTNRPPWLPWQIRRLEENEAAAADELATATAAWQEAATRLTAQRSGAQDAQDAVRTRRADELARAAARASSQELALEHARWAEQERDVARGLADVERQLESFLAQTRVMPHAHQIVEDAQRRGVLDLLKDRERFEQRVHHLDRLLRELDRRRIRLDDEYEAAWRRVATEAPVVGCTMSTLTDPMLAQRRFDLVVVDEAGAAEFAATVHAGSRADDGLVLLGHRAGPPEGWTGEGPWVHVDAFTVLGVTDDDSARAHSRCVALD
ncbi:hypothetical protein JL107_14880 [Nakamurella flavida]|uniref:DNA2/NAM7 helicase helicase domain-containing protein n=1 Tax=Nakamurella flavida TaxID=363630 RepID=A0A939C680_9ACTN|nr:hypothetical protein [Nakamurella flavida]